MRLLAPALLLVLALPGFAEELEAITLRDGRTLIGRYDEAERKLYLRAATGGKVRMAITVSPGDISERNPWEDPVEQAARDAAAAEAKRSALDTENRRAAAASAAVRDTIAAQDERRREQEAQAAERAKRIDAEARASYWSKQGVTFDPAVYSARDMDLAVERMEQRKRERVEQEAEHARQAAAERLKQDQDAERRQVLSEARRQAAMERSALVQAQERRAADAAAVERQRLVDEQRERERKSTMMAITVALVVIALYSIPLIVALARRHRFRLPIAVLCLVCPFVLGGVWAFRGNSELAAAIGAGVAAAIGAVFGLVSWLGALVWAVMPGMAMAAPARDSLPGRPRRTHRVASGDDGDPSASSSAEG